MHLYVVCEPSIFNKADECMISTLEMWIHRRILKIPCTAHKTKKMGLQEVNQRTELLTRVKELKLTYFGHTKRTNGIENKIMEGQVDGSKSRSRPKIQWIDISKKWLEIWQTNGDIIIILSSTR